MALGPAALDGWLTGEVAAVVGVVLAVADFTVAVPPDTAGVVVGGVVVAEAICWRTASDGFDPPLPPTGTVVAGAGVTVVFVVAGAAVVGVVAGAAVVTVLPDVP